MFFPPLRPHPAGITLPCPLLQLLHTSCARMQRLWRVNPRSSRRVACVQTTPRRSETTWLGPPPSSHPIPCVSGRFTVLSVRCRFEPHVFGTICYSFFGFTHGGCSNEAEPEIAVGLALQNYDIPCENLPKSQRLQPCVRFLYL